ncbi:MAG: hypothetical protein ACOVLE_16080, partial [Pirellula staleyi]
MSLELFRDRLNQSRLHPNDIKWMPRWFGQFAQNRPAIDGLIWFGTEDVLKFLQKLRDGKVPAWLRCSHRVETDRERNGRKALVTVNYRPAGINPTVTLSANARASVAIGTLRRAVRSQAFARIPGG